MVVEYFASHFFIGELMVSSTVNWCFIVLTRLLLVEVVGNACYFQSTQSHFHTKRTYNFSHQVLSETRVDRIQIVCPFIVLVSRLVAAVVNTTHVSNQIKV